MAEIHLEDVSRVFPNGVPAVERLNLTVQDGEMLALVGPSGSGKSTTLRLIAGLDRPTSGEIRIGGESVGRVPAWKRNVALSFQRAVLFPQRTVFENLAFGNRFRGRGECRGGENTSIEIRVQEVADAVGISGLLSRYPGELSGGEQQRVSLARSLVFSPRALLLDEPLSHLDATLRSELRDVLKRMHRRRPLTTVIVTHDPVEALSLGDRVAVMRRGAIEQIGSPDELYEVPATAFVADFVGELPLNRMELPAVPTGEGFCVALAGRKFVFPRESEGHSQNEIRRRVVLGIRPHDIAVERANEVGSVNVEESVEVAGSIEEILYQGRQSILMVRLSQCDGGSENNSFQRGGMWRVLAGGDQKIQLHEFVRLRFGERRMHWFDGPSGRNLRR